MKKTTIEVNKIYKENVNKIRNLYNKENFSIKNIATIIGIDSISLFKRMSTDNLTKKRNPKGTFDKFYSLNSDEIRNLYVHKEMSSTDIAKKFNVNPIMLRERLRKDKITRTKSEASRCGRHKQIRSGGLLFEANKEAILQDYKQNVGVRDLEIKYGFKLRTLSGILKRRKLQKTSSERIYLSKRSSYELLAEKFLIDNNIEFIPQYSFEFSPYSYDFCLPNLFILIEVDGIYWHRLEEFSKYSDYKRIHSKDKYKTNKAEKEGYKLIRITDRQIDKMGIELLAKKLKEVEVG